MTGEQRRTVEQEIRGLDEEWKCLLRPWWKAGGYKIIKNLDDLLAEIGEENFHPSLCAAFRPFKCLKPCEVKVVIVGQDPYPQKENATGLAFSLPKNEKRYPRRKYAPCVHSIYDALEKDGGIEGTMPEEVGNLDYLAKQDVLLMNASFTYPKQTEWHNFSREIIRALSEKHKCLVFMLWGGDAKSVGNHICQNNGHKVFPAYHPSYCPKCSGQKRSCPFETCERGQPFINGAGGGNHFSAANEFLGHDRQIDWLPSKEKKVN
jgi:uracil-DNA glycosylase